MASADRGAAGLPLGARRERGGTLRARGEGRATGGTLTVGSLVEPPGLDPFHQGADARIRVTVLMYQGLFDEPVDGEAAPLLAESYEVSPDKLVYTVKLRQGVKFHTGQPMTAKDVAYSYNYIRDPKNGSPGAGDYTVITAIDAIDDSTVKITLSQPNASLPMTLGNKYGAVIPAGYFDVPDSKTKLNQTSVGTGPFKLVEFKPNSNLTLARNPDYWEKGAPYLDQVNFVSIPNSASMLVGLTNKRVDLALLNRPQDVRQVEKVPGLKTERWPSLNQKAIDLGSEYTPLRRPARAPGDRARRRQGRGDARLDRWPRTSNRHHGRRDAGPLGAAPPQVPNQKPDVEKAKKLLAEAAHPSGIELNLTTIIGYDWMDPAAITLREQLAKIGVKVNIQRVELGVWIKNFQSKQMGFTFNDWATQPDPNLLFYRHFRAAPEGADFRNWKNETASKLLDQGRAEADPAKRKAIYLEFQKEMAQSVPTIMLFSADLVDGEKREGPQLRAAPDRLVLRDCPHVSRPIGPVSRGPRAAGPLPLEQADGSIPDAEAGGLAATALLASVIVFALVRSVPGDVVAQMLGQTSDPTRNARCASSSASISPPMPVSDLVDERAVGQPRHELDQGPPVGQLITSALLVTLELGLMTLIVATAIGVPLGLVAGIYEGRPRQDHPVVQPPRPRGPRLLGRADAARRRVFPRRWSPPLLYVPPSASIADNLAILACRSQASACCRRPPTRSSFARALSRRSTRTTCARPSPKASRSGSSSSSTFCATSASRSSPLWA